MKYWLYNKEYNCLPNPPKKANQYTILTVTLREIKGHEKERTIKNNNSRFTSNSLDYLPFHTK